MTQGSLFNSSFHNAPFQKIELDFYIDVHAHSTLMNGFMYGNIYEDLNRFERQAIFPKLLCGNAEDFSLTNTAFNRDAVKAGTGRRSVCLRVIALQWLIQGVRR